MYTSSAYPFHIDRTVQTLHLINFILFVYDKGTLMLDFDGEDRFFR